MRTPVLRTTRLARAPWSRALALSAALLLAACAGRPVPPDWQVNAVAALQGFSAAYLSGDTRLADYELSRAKSEIARTGRADLLARAELTRCATRVASLEFDACAAYQPLAADAPAGERAYAAFLSGDWTGLDPALLPAHYRSLVLQSRVRVASEVTATATSVLLAIEDPLARLVAAGALLQNSRMTPADIVLASDTASGQGWRRPLLAWLGLQLKLANEAGDPVASARLRRRIDLVLQTTQKTQ